MPLKYVLLHKNKRTQRSTPSIMRHYYIHHQQKKKIPKIACLHPLPQGGLLATLLVLKTCSVISIKNSSHTFVFSPQLSYFYKRTFYQHDPAALGCAGTPTAWEGCVQISQVSTFHTGAEEIHLDLKSVFPVTFNKLLFYCGSFP